MNTYDTAVEFLEKLKIDDAMQKRMEAAMDDAANPLHAAVAFAIAEGFFVTADSLDAARENLGMNGMLSDSEMELVSAGFDPQPEPPGRTSPSSKTTPQYDPSLSNKLLRW